MNTVLVIDDNAGVTAALALLFSLHDIHTLCAASPAEGLALLDQPRGGPGDPGHELPARHHLGRH